MFIKRSNIFLRAQLIVSSTLVLIFIVTGLFIYYNLRKKTYATMQEQFINEVDELIDVVNVYRVRDRDILNMIANFAEYKINEYSDFKIK